MKVSSTSIRVCRVVNVPYFKINGPVFCCPLFFVENLNSQIRINKMGNEHTVDYHLSLLKQGYTLSHFYGLLRGLSLQNISWNFSQTCIYIPATMVLENRPLGESGVREGNGPPLILKSYFAKDVSLEMCLYVHLQGIENFFWSGIPIILLGALEKF